MNRAPRILLSPAKRLMGLHLPMSFARDRTAELWQTFMPRRKEILRTLNTDLISLQIYPYPFPWPPDLNAGFEKWATMEVTPEAALPEGMEALQVPPGMYAVFHHIGSIHTARATFAYIFDDWLPRSPYVLDDRPHFEVLGEKYRHLHPESEEEIWIPIMHRDTP